MSKTIKIPIVGIRPTPYNRQRLEERRIRERALRMERHRKPEKPDDFIIYENSDSEEETPFEQHMLLNTSYNFVDLIQSREMNIKEVRVLDRSYASKYVLTHDMLKEHPLLLGNVNKIFCSQWLNNRQIIYGTKCNRIMIYNVNTKKIDNIPTIPSSEPCHNDGQPAIINGIHSIRINPSRTLMATGGRHSADVAIYKLPTLDPLNIGENGHRDWIMDLCWLDDEFLVSGSKDAKISFWRANETFTDENENDENNENDETDDDDDDADDDDDDGAADADDESQFNDGDGEYDDDDDGGDDGHLALQNSLKKKKKKGKKTKKKIVTSTTTTTTSSSSINGNTAAAQSFPKHAKIIPLVTRECKTAQKIRSMCFNDEYKEIIVLSLNGYIHLFNAETFTQTLSRKLPNCQDNVCIAHQPRGLYAIGCRSYTLLLDPRTLQSVKKIASRYSGCGIRSASFQENLLTVGTGLGMVMFYDVRAGKYLENCINSARTVALKASKGYVFPEEDMEGFQQIKYVPAIYTHCYDSSGTRLFAAGGPLPANLVGNYAGIWQ